MGTIRYFLSTKLNSKGEGQIYIDILSDKTTHYRLKSGLYISPETFNRLIKSDRILSLDYLYRFDELITKALPCSKEDAQKILQMAQGGNNDILSLYDEFSTNRITEKGLTKGTQELYQNVRVVIVGMLKNKPTSVKTLNTQFFNEFIMAMTNKGLNNNTQLNYWRTFKVFLKYLVENNYLDSKVLLYKPKFKTAVNDVVYLTHNELYRLFMLDLRNNKPYERIRDAFVIQCMTGLRHSDLVNIKKDRIKEDINGKYVSLLTKKTSQRLKIYLNSTCCEILEKYDYNISVRQRDYSNKTLEKIAELAHIDSEVEIVSFVGSKRIVEHKKKYECIRTHTGRRTFICLSIEAGISTPVIQSITGHTQLRSFERYVGIGDKSKADNVSKLEL